jgi:hypothetical protein
MSMTYSGLNCPDKSFSVPDITKYFRVHTADIAYATQQPRGLFTAIGKLVDSKTLSDVEVTQYWENRHWFEKHLPVPPFYADGNAGKAIIWFKSSAEGTEMFEKMGFYKAMASKYGVKLYLTTTDLEPGTIVYEAAFQIGVMDGQHSGDGFQTELLM